MGTINGQAQNIWDNGNGALVYWNGAENKYIKLIIINHKINR